MRARMLLANKHWSCYLVLFSPVIYCSVLNGTGLFLMIRFVLPKIHITDLTAFATAAAQLHSW